MPREITRVSDVLKFRDRGPSVEDAKKAMLEAGQAPPGKHTVPVDDNAIEPEFDDNGEVVVAANPNEEEQAAEAERLRLEAEAASPTPAPVVAPLAEEKTERFETEQFVGEIKQDKGKWVAEIQYKNGSGTERFTAGSKNELMLELLKGKGHATLRVKEAVRREKLGGRKLDKSYTLPEDTTAEEFSKMPPKTQSLIIDNIAVQNAMIFIRDCPAYYGTDANKEVLNEYMKEHNLPFTVNNLWHAFEDLAENDLFPDKRGAASPTPSLARPTVATRTEDSSAVASPAAAPSAPSKTESQPAPVARKRGSTGLPVGHSSVPSDGSANAEDNGKPEELSDAELRKLPMDELKRIANAERRSRAQSRL